MVRASGTLGQIIPPSIVLVIYAILTEQNISKLFAAAIVPDYALGSHVAALASDLVVTVTPGHEVDSSARVTVPVKFFGSIVGGAGA